MIDARAGVRDVVLAATAATLLLTATVAVRADTATRASATERAPRDSRAIEQRDEQEMLAAARREADERKQGPVVNIGEPAPADRAALEKQRHDELQRLSDKLRRASALRPATRPGPAVETPWMTEVTIAPRQPLAPETRSALGNRDVATAEADDGRVTVLMVMTPGNRGIRRFDKSADPILCTLDGCYISSGATTAAQFVSLRRTFGFSHSFGVRAGACNHQTACVFRGVDISAANAVLQPVDMRVVSHDRRGMKAAAADPTCRVDSGFLACGRPIRGEGYTLWVVPERIAAKAGSIALQRAIDTGLGGPVAKASAVPGLR